MTNWNKVTKDIRENVLNIKAKSRRETGTSSGNKEAQWVVLYNGGGAYGFAEKAERRSENWEVTKEILLS